MAIFRRTLLSVALAVTGFRGAGGRLASGRAQHRQPTGAADRDRVLLAHLPALRRASPARRCRSSRPSGSLQASCAGCSTTSPPTWRHLQAAMVARYLPADRYERFIDTLFATQDRWAFGAGSVTMRSGRWRATPGMDRDDLRPGPGGHGAARLDHRAGAGRRARWHVDATPSFVINGKLYTGAMSAREFATILGS